MNQYEMHCSIASILKVTVDCSLNTGIVPNAWKIANVTPLFKKGDQLQLYQPNSLTSITIWQEIFKDKNFRGFQ